MSLNRLPVAAPSASVSEGGNRSARRAGSYAPTPGGTKARLVWTPNDGSTTFGNRRGRSILRIVVTAVALVWSACGDGGSSSKGLEASAAIDIGQSSSGVATGEEAVWVADGESTVVRVDPETNSIAGRISVPSGAENLAVGEGAVWVTGGSALSRIDPSRNEVTGTVELGEPQGLAAGDGSVWVANRAGNGTLSRVDSKTMDVAATLKVPPMPDDDLALPQEPGQVAVGEGGVWVSDTRVGTVSRLDPDEEQFTQTISRLPPNSRALAIGAGSIWVAAEYFAARADPDRRFPETLEFSDNPLPSGVAVGLGSAWITNVADNTLTRVDPDTNRPTRAIELQETPVAVSVGFGAVWVAGQEGLLTRVDER